MAQRDQVITWRGEEKQFSPAFRFLRGLDARLQSDKDRPTNLLQVANVMANGGNEYLDIPIVWAAFLREAGFDATEDDCWAIVSAVHSMAATGDQKADYVAFYLVLSQSLVPAIDLGKQPDPQEAAPEPSRIETKEATSGA